MRRLLIVLLAAACGGKVPTVQATQQIKDGAAVAQRSLQGSSSGSLAAIGFNNITSVLVTATNPQALTLSGLPNLVALAAAASAPPRHGTSGAIAPPRSAAATSSLAVGCLKPDPSASPNAMYVKPGDPGCNASDHLEVDYVAGDELDIVYTATSSSFEFNISIPSGRWTGTALDVLTTSNGSNAPVSVHARGAVKYQPDAGESGVDSDLDFSYQITNVSDTDQRAVLQASGSAVDHVDPVKTSFTWTTTVHLDRQNHVSGLEWGGSQSMSLLDGSGAVQNAVEFSNVSVLASLQGGITAVTGFTAAGDVLWNGARAGSVVAKDPEDVVIRWTDGTETALNPIAVFGSPL